MKKHLVINLVGIACGMLVYFYLSYDSLQRDLGPLTLILSGLCGAAVAYSIWFLNLWLNTLIPWRAFPGSRLLLGIISGSVFSYLIILSLLYVYWTLFVSVQVEWTFMDLWPAFIKLGIILFVLVLLFSVIYFALFSYNSFAKHQVAHLALEREQIDLQIKALKSQLSPHFLFNSLNTISSLLLKDSKKAENFVRQLAKSYHYTLSTYDKRWVSLEEELVFVKAYQFLLATRFEESMRFEQDVPAHLLATKIPPLSLQMLVENAVKHNQISPEWPLNVEIGSDGKWLWVKNNITEKPKGVASFHIGLENIRARYQVLADREIIVQHSPEFIVRLPIIA